LSSGFLPLKIVFVRCHGNETHFQTRASSVDLVKLRLIVLKLFHLLIGLDYLTSCRLDS